MAIYIVYILQGVHKKKDLSAPFFVNTLYILYYTMLYYIILYELDNEEIVLFFNISISRDIEDAKKYSAPDRKALKIDLKKGLSSLISSSKARNIRETKRPTLVRI